jgi:phage terminase Nu1 subunit (DNA packaging protein)
MSEDSDLMTRTELAAIARVHRNTLADWAAQGIGPRPIRHGPRLIRYQKREVYQWLREGDAPEAAVRDGPEAA